MKIPFSLLLVAMLTLLAGCGDASKPVTPAKEVNPADVNNPLVNAKRTADKTTETAALNQAIQLFNVQEGRLPKALRGIGAKIYRQDSRGAAEL